MEAFAVLKLEKKKKAEKFAQLLNPSPQSNRDRSKPEVDNKLRVELGYPHAPGAVFSLGKANCAAVWWEWPRSDEGIIGWEIHRYRKDNDRVTNGTWKYKGFTKVAGKLEKKQFIVEELTDGYQYRFSVKAVNDRGASAESSKSGPVVIETPLPSGWFRFYDNSSDRFFYANLKTKQSYWMRPESLPYFLDEFILFNFERREIEHLVELFDEDIAHHRCIKIAHFPDLLREVGEKMSNGKIRRLFETFGETNGSAEPIINTWTQFMNVMDQVKRLKKQGFIPLPTVGLTTLISQGVAAMTMGLRDKKYENWIVLHSDFVGRDYYKHVQTGETRWSMPDEVRFYLPTQLTKQLLTAFTHGHIEAFKRNFSMLDVDGSGDLSEQEIRVLLQQLHIKVSDSLFWRLMRSVDLNGNGTVEFDEFCYMMYTLARRGSGGGVWREISDYNQQLADEGQDDNSAVMSVSRMGNRIMRIYVDGDDAQGEAVGGHRPPQTAGDDHGPPSVLQASLEGGDSQSLAFDDDDFGSDGGEHPYHREAFETGSLDDGETWSEGGIRLHGEGYDANKSGFDDDGTALSGRTGRQSVGSRVGAKLLSASVSTLQAASTVSTVAARATRRAAGLFSFGLCQGVAAVASSAVQLTSALKIMPEENFPHGPYCMCGCRSLG